MPPITHTKVSAKADSPDTSEVRPSDWNDDHIDTGDQVSETTAKARAYRAVQQDNLANNVWTKILLDTETFDPGSNFDLPNSKFIAPEDGWYLIIAKAHFTNTVASKYHAAGFYIEGVLAQAVNMYSGVGQTSGITPVATDVVFLNATDEVELWAWQNTGLGTVDIVGGTEHTFLTVHLLSI